MDLQFIDMLLFVVIGGFGLFGLWFGFIHTLGSLVGTVLGIYLASRYYEPVALWLMQVTGWGENLSRIVVFALAFILINRLVGLVFWLLNRVFRIITRLPFLRSIDRLFGLFFGLFEGALTVGFIIFLIERYPLSSAFMERLSTSVVAPITVGLAELLWPLLPEALRILQSTVEYVHQKIF